MELRRRLCLTSIPALLVQRRLRWFGHASYRIARGANELEVRSRRGQRRSIWNRCVQRAGSTRQRYDRFCSLVASKSSRRKDAGSDSVRRSSCKEGYVGLATLRRTGCQLKKGRITTKSMLLVEIQRIARRSAFQRSKIIISIATLFI